MEENNLPRKSCDLCYRRKIKCDGQKPRCSNCVAYESECRHTAPSRRSKPKSQRNKGTAESEEIKRLRAEIQHLKAQFNQYTVQDRGQEPPHQHGKHIPAVLLEDEAIDDEEENTITSMKLPPLENAMALLGIFFKNLNSVLPLFNDEALIRLFGECYATLPQQRDPVIWAAINIVLALATQHMPKGSSHPSGNSKPRSYHINKYLNRAQSVVSTVMLGKVQLLNVQVLVGMVLVLQTAHDPTQSLILISATMRLAHKLGLHNRALSAHLDPEERIQHARVFWLVYILDKDLSLRSGQPSLQHDDDIDLDLPSTSTSSLDGEGDGNANGIIVTADGNAKMNYFSMRVHLANIEGGVYDYLYSTRSLKRSPEERTMAMESILDALEKWKDSVPPEFSANVVTSNTNNNPAMAGFFCALHAASLACATLISGAHAWNQQWMMSLRHHGRGTHTVKLPPRWDALVHQAREYAVLFGETWSSDAWFRWITACSYTSSLVLLTTNNLQDPQHEEIQQDMKLVDAAVVWLNQDFEETHSAETQPLREVCAELVREVQRKHTEAIARQLSGGWGFDVPENVG